MAADGNVSGMMEWVPKILNFGFLGLSFLMVYMGYRLTKRVVDQGEDRPESMKLTKFFLTIAVVFMTLAGPLQWLTMWITAKTVDNSIVLFVGANNPSWEKEYGEVYISTKGKLKAISKSTVEEKFVKGDEIKIELSEVAKAIDRMRQQLIKINETKKTPELKNVYDGG
jgi:hypothetical protein